jgi:myosin heavy subunit
MNFDISTLTAAESFWDSVGVWLAIAVAVGVALEAVTEFDKLARWLRLDTQERFALKHTIAKAGLLLLILALSFEVVAAIKTHNISEQIIAGLNGEIRDNQQREQELITETKALRDENNELQTALSKQEGTLQSLTSRSDKFETTANTLKRRMETSLTTLEKAKNDVLANASKAGAALDVVKKAQTELIAAVTTINELQQQVHDLTTDRTIDVRRVAGKLKSFAKVPFVLEVSDDVDALDLSGQIGTALEQAGWEWKENKASDNSLEFGKQLRNKPRMRIATGRGVMIQLATVDVDTLGSAAGKLIDALKDENLKNVSGYGLDDEEMKNGKKIYGVIHIFVGTKN